MDPRVWHTYVREALLAHETDWGDLSPRSSRFCRAFLRSPNLANFSFQKWKEWDYVGVCWKTQMDGGVWKLSWGQGSVRRGGNANIWRLYFCHLGWDTPKARLGQDYWLENLTCSFHIAWGSSQHSNWVLRGRVLTAGIPNRANNMICSVLSHFSRVWLFATPWTAAHQDPLSMEFSGQEY